MFGNRLKSILENSDMSQTQLAQELELTSPAVNRWCNNVTQPDTDTIVKIAKILNVSTDYLLGNDNSLSKKEEEIREIDTLKRLLIKNNYMKENEDLSNKDLEKLMSFIKANKEFIKENK